MPCRTRPTCHRSPINEAFNEISFEMGKALPLSNLEMPKEEREDQANAETHEPGDEQEHAALDVGEMSQHWHPFGDPPGRRCEYFALCFENFQSLNFFFGIR